MHLPKEAAHNMLEKSNCLLFNQLGDHIAQNGSNSVESLISGTNVGKSDIIKQDLLHDEDGHSFAQLGACLHDAQAKGDDFGGQQEVDYIRRVILHQRTDHTEGGQAQVFERTRFRSGIKKWVKKKRNMR